MSDPAAPFRRVEHHMSTAVTLGGSGISDAVADAFFARVAELEARLSRFRPDSDISRLARGEIDLDHVDPSVRQVITGCETLRSLTGGAFEHEPRRLSGDPGDPVLDVNAYAKGWIIEESVTVLSMAAGEYFVNAGGDVLAGERADGSCWRVGVQHPSDRASIIGTFELRRGAVATSGTSERGEHIRIAGPAELVSVTVTGPELAVADGLATAVFASGDEDPRWWGEVDPAYGLLTVSDEAQVRWLPPIDGVDVVWEFPAGADVVTHPE